LTIFKRAWSFFDGFVSPAKEKAILSGWRPGGLFVSHESALTFSAVYAAINAISTDLAVPPLLLYRRAKDDSRDEQFDHPSMRPWRVTPDDETTPIMLRQALVGHAVGRGNGYAELTFAGGELSGFHLLDPRTRPRRRPEDKTLYYELPNRKTLPPGRVFHLANFGVNGLEGMSPVELHRRSIGIGLNVEATELSTYENGGVPRGLLKTPKRLSKEAVERLRENWNNIHGGPENAGNVAVLEEGMEWVATTLKHDDQQFLQLRQFQVLDIARIFRVPPSKIGDWSQNPYASAEVANLDYVASTLLGWAVKFEQQCNLKLLTEAERRAGFYFEHDFAVFLRADLKAMFEAYGTAVQNGLVNRDEARRRFGLGPIKAGGKTHTVQVNLTPLDRLGRDQNQARSEVDDVEG
jgi:HK97 family phage portal protein